MKIQNHIDGQWITSEYTYKNIRIQIKARKGHGIKAHVFKPDNETVDFTLRNSFCPPNILLERAKKKIDLRLTKLIKN